MGSRNIPTSTSTSLTTPLEMVTISGSSPSIINSDISLTPQPVSSCTLHPHVTLTYRNPLPPTVSILCPPLSNHTVGVSTLRNVPPPLYNKDDIFSLVVHSPVPLPRPTSIPNDHLVVIPPHEGLEVGRAIGCSITSRYILFMVKTCAKVYYDNCRNNPLCQGCTVTGGDTYLYSPIEDKVGAPCNTTKVGRDNKHTYTRRKKAGRRSQKAGYEAERAIFQRLGGTHNPTSQGYDGTIGCLRVEYKVRLAGGSVLPTKSEWQKAVDQGNKLVIVEDKVTCGGTVTMSIETFEALREYME